MGPHTDSDSAVNIGVAAHITAASSGGPRYDASLSTEERRSAENGIRACQSCAKLIDSDDARFSTEMLKHWKATAEQHALTAIRAQKHTVRQVAVLRQTLTGHSNYVWDVVITPDGRKVLSASNDKSVKLWDIASGVCLATFTGHNSFVCSISLSSNSKHLAAGAADGAIKIWELATAQALAEFSHGAEDAKVAWGPKPQQLASGGANGVINLWRFPDLTPIGSIAVHTKAILKVLILDDAERIVTVSADGTARICRASTGECLQVFDGHTGEVNSVAVTSDKRQLISASQDCTLKVWEIESGKCQATLRGHCQVIWRVAVSPDCTLLASGAADNTVRLWDLKSHECIQELTHPDCVAAVAFSPDGSSLAVGCDDSRVYVYSINQGSNS